MLSTRVWGPAGGLATRSAAKGTHPLLLVEADCPPRQADQGKDHKHPGEQARGPSTAEEQASKRQAPEGGVVCVLPP